MDDAKTIRTIFISFMIVGLLVFSIGTIISIKYIVVDVINKERTTGTIVKIGDSSTKVEYPANGRLYSKTFSVYSSSYYVGKKIKIYYNKLNPKKSLIAGMRYLTLIVPGIGIILLGISGIGLMYVYVKYYRV